MKTYCWLLLFFALPLMVGSCSTDKRDFFSLQSEIKGIQAFTTIKDAQAYSKETGIPILLIFDAWNTSMRKSSELLTSYLKKETRSDYVITYLFVDDKTKLPKPYEYTFPNGRAKTISTIGDEHLVLEMNLLNQAVAPYHVIVDHELTIIKEPLGFISDEQMIKDYLSID